MYRFIAYGKSKLCRGQGILIEQTLRHWDAADFELAWCQTRWAVSHLGLGRHMIRGLGGGAAKDRILPRAMHTCGRHDCVMVAAVPIIMQKRPGRSSQSSTRHQMSRRGSSVERAPV
jgi:hypothetical protein